MAKEIIKKNSGTAAEKPLTDKVIKGAVAAGTATALIAAIYTACRALQKEKEKKKTETEAE